MKKSAWSAAFVLGIGLLAESSQAQLRVVEYNTGGGARDPYLTNILSAIGAESVNGIAKPIDVLSLEEQNTVGTTTQSIVNILNSIYGAGTYARGVVDAGSTGAGRSGLIYNTHTVQLINESTVGTTSTSGQARQGMRYQLRPLGYDSSADFYVYSDHYKADNTPSDAARRNVEAQNVRANADALGQGAHIIYTGDYNVYTSSEAMYQTLLSAGNGQAFDPINKPGDWHDNVQFKAIHTQAPSVGVNYSGQTTGGVDDRFDFQLSTAEVQDGTGFAYIPGSYHAFGNNGTHNINSKISSGTGASQTVLISLEYASDHLPVVADYQVPAKMSVNVAGVPTRVIQGASVNASVQVSNSADVIVANGADKLDYTVVGGGDVNGGATGTDFALGGSNTHDLAINTATPHVANGTINVTSSSESVANGTFQQAVQVQVLAHSKAQFTNAGGTPTSMTIDFGTAQQGSSHTETFGLTNVESVLGLTAGLDLDEITLQTPDAGALSTDLSTFADLLAGQTATFSTTLDASQVGTFSEQYLLKLSDEDLPGATGGQELLLTLNGTIVPEPASIGLIVLSALTIVSRRRRAR